MDEQQQHGDGGATALIEHGHEHDEREPDQIPDAVRKVVEAKDEGEVRSLDAAVIADATGWLLDNDEEIAKPQTATRTITIAQDRKVRWTVRALTGAEIRVCRKEAMGNREQRRRLMQDGDPTAVDEGRYHGLIVLTATIDPDLLEAARIKGVHPIQVLESRFRYLPGVLAELSGVVMDISGYNPDIVEEEVAGAAAGNS